MEAVADAPPEVARPKRPRKPRAAKDPAQAKPPSLAGPAAKRIYDRLVADMRGMGMEVVCEGPKHMAFLTSLVGRQAKAQDAGDEAERFAAAEEHITAVYGRVTNAPDSAFALKGLSAALTVNGYEGLANQGRVKGNGRNGSRNTMADDPDYWERLGESITTVVGADA